jgi:acetyl-CoA C-acetyltransferase
MPARDAVIVSTARTGIGKAYRGAFNATPSPTLAAHPIRAAVERAKVDPAEVDDVIMGAALQQGVQTTIGRTAALRAGLPVTVAGMSIDRQCASGLMAIATAAKQVIVDRMDIVVAGGVESISLVQTPEMRLGPDPELLSMHNAVYMPMIDTAEVVGARYTISRERCDEYALRSQQRTAAAQAAGKFDDEIIPVTTRMAVKDKETGEVSMREVTLDKDEGNRPETTLEGLAKLEPVRGPDKIITAGNASQLSDGASICVVMEAGVAEKRGLQPLGGSVGVPNTGSEPDALGIGDDVGVPQLLDRCGV